MLSRFYDFKAVRYPYYILPRSQALPASSFCKWSLEAGKAWERVSIHRRWHRWMSIVVRDSRKPGRKASVCSVAIVSLWLCVPPVGGNSRLVAVFAIVSMVTAYYYLKRSQGGLNSKKYWASRHTEPNINSNRQEMPIQWLQHWHDNTIAYVTVFW